MRLLRLARALHMDVAALVVLPLAAMVALCALVCTNGSCG